MNKIMIFPNIYKLSRAAAEFFVTQAKDAIREQSQFAVVLSGGATPESLYALLATDAYRVRINWEKTCIFWGDERCVPPDNINSNYRMAKYALLEHVPLPAENIHRIPGEHEPHKAAQEYEAVLKSIFGSDSLPRFDLIFLGLGEDGHTASLFPQSEALHSDGKWVLPNFLEEHHTWRVTLSTDAINAAAKVVFLVTGASKAERVRDVLEGEHQPETFPAQLIAPTDGDLIWLLDEEAASLLTDR